jgi:GTPase SAR1 family protein
MGCFPSKANDGANVELERQLLQERLENLYQFKVLLLGAGESGKSTVVKQLRMIHNKKLDSGELTSVADSLHQNVIDCTKALLYACQKFEYELDDETDRKTAELVMSFDDSHRISYELGTAIVKLFNSTAIKTTFKRQSEYWLLDSCGYYMKNLERFTEVGFTPTEEDCVMARIRTTGIVVSELEHKIPKECDEDPDALKFQVVDVGGQRNERKKWMHCFDDVKCILFIVNLAGYNQVLFEDNTKNRMKESLELFADITKRAIFKDTPIFLFLNKKDLFENLIKETDLSVSFPEYTGGNDLKNSLDFVTAKFTECLPHGKEVHTEVVTGVWRRDIKCAFEEVKKKLFDDNKKTIDDEKKRIRKEVKCLK